MPVTKEEVIAELKARGVELHIGACGCCGSPWVKIKIDERDFESEYENFGEYDN
jgi:hypothetical protein